MIWFGYNVAKNGGIGLLVYFLGTTIILPVVMAIAFLFKTNSLLRRAAVFFMAFALTAGAVWAAVH